ncbi:YggS family pyridoxal phosphate-dependent enzyme [Fulvivirgaceae bacterium PWU5]|uniref:Pyridoxal phosphate homeostasis protein n=1 Tax=Dawidia cretensis TaxID=2782350 RepID=A0AAP2E274_9BACT|nr:YggS family pyridoxal phosphate-dependent enzyme [Dawidia cretensis]MBT1711740.1 YggS family pyridoxal phosphate-dependent enzyme [Dawidia cretensis]
MNIKNNITNLRQTLPPGCRLVAVSKTQPLDKIQEAYASGQRDFGENRVQELIGKYEQLPQDIHWHLIGHLQTNKVKYIAPFVSLIHSVDSPRLLEEINNQAGKAGRVIDCLLQVHIAQEETKYGLTEEEARTLITSPALRNYQHIRIQGLMGMGSLTDNTEQVRREFRSLKTFFDRLQHENLPSNASMTILSMGMSSDYKIAIEEGSTMLRIGTSLFKTT